MHEKPIYLVIFEELKEKIQIGAYKPNEALPSEIQLCDIYGVSRLTARKAIESLIAEGLVYFVPGKGNFVRQSNETEFCVIFNETQFESITVDKVSIIDVDIIESTKELVYILGINPKIRVLRIRRLLFSANLPIGFDCKYIPYYPGIPLVENELEAKTFVQILSDRTSPYSVEIDLSIKAVAASRETASGLNLNDGDCVFKVEQVLSDKELGIIGYSETYYNPLYVKMKAVWNR